MNQRALPIVYGIPNCDTVRKARAWLKAAGIDSVFHDLRKDSVPMHAVDRWVAVAGADALINRRGTTWRQLDPVQQAQAGTAEGVRGLIQSEPSVLKRPVVDWGDAVTIGFDPDIWTSRINTR